MTLTMHLFHTEDGDIYGPLVTCDHCGKVIESATNGNVEYKVDNSGDMVDGGALYFTHKACCRDFEAAHGGRITWRWEELAYFVIYLGNGLHLDWKEAKRRAAFMGSI